MTGDDRLLDAWRERRGTPPAGCLDAETLWAAVEGELPAEEFSKIAEHSMLCPECAEYWRYARSLGSNPPAAASAAVPTGPRPFSRWLAAAAILVAVGATWWWNTQRDSALSQVPIERSPQPQTPLRSLLEDGAALPRTAFVLHWSAAEPGTLYDIEVGTPELRLLARASALEQPSYRVDPDRLSDLPAGSQVVWQVWATLPDGRRIASASYANQIE